MDDLTQDLRYAVRLLGRNPAFTAVVALTLALGIGANTAIFTLMDQILLRPLPVRAPGELVLIEGPGADSGRREGRDTLSYPMYRDFRDHGGEVLQGVVARAPVALSAAQGGRTERVRGELVSGNYFEELGVGAAAGRVIGPDDDRDPGGHPVVVLGHGYWTRRFGADPSVVGRALNVNGHPLTVVGVAQRGFHGVEVGQSADVFVPVAMKAPMTPTLDDLQNRRSKWVHVLARLRPGVTREGAKAKLDVLYAGILQEEIKTIETSNELFKRRFLAKRLELRPAARGLSPLRAQVTTPLLVLMGMVGLVLLIACANVANLLMARATGRQKELAIRLTLGASRGRIVRQLLAESLVLSLLGGALGVALAVWVSDVLVRALPVPGVAQSLATTPDLRVGLFTLGVSLLTGLLFGLVPALSLSRPAMATIKEEAGTVVGGGSARLRKGLVVAQVALSLLLLVGAGLFARSLLNLRQLDPGFVADRLLTFSVDPALNGYPQPAVREFFASARQRIAALPGVRAVSGAVNPIMTDSRWDSTVRVEGYRAKEGEDMNPMVNWVGPSFFSTLGVQVLAGREFRESDTLDAPRVAVVNETFARYFFGDQSPVGRRFGFGRDEKVEIEIVGLVRDGRELTLRAPIPRTVYVPYMQEEDLSQLTFYARTDLPEEAVVAGVRHALQGLDPQLPLYDLRTMRATIGESLFVERMVALLSAAFGFLATLLAAVGLYGVMTYTVARRTREIGIRMALGAPARRVLAMVLREVALLAAVGIAMGLPAAWALARVLRAQLFGLSPHDPLTAAAAVLLLAAVTLAAGFLPARRATRVDPLVALRAE
jgi:predicted permease